MNSQILIIESALLFLFVIALFIFKEWECNQKINQVTIFYIKHKYIFIGNKACFNSYFRFYYDIIILQGVEEGEE
ncbi:unnamed protein product [Paramecium pentaurelia]|uniref:Uncharacterized protein n=1 Tax=Paramecium pentaurelia TaxID=43138 RepID=A0A8S1T010_9CILI|nr:unnamed protein product [Paramecium pentaurelia]